MLSNAIYMHILLCEELYSILFQMVGRGRPVAMQVLGRMVLVVRVVMEEGVETATRIPMKVLPTSESERRRLSQVSRNIYHQYSTPEGICFFMQASFLLLVIPTELYVSNQISLWL